jgi:hypothetical protein
LVAQLYKSIKTVAYPHQRTSLRPCFQEGILIDLSTIFHFIVDKSIKCVAFTQSKSQPGLGPGWLSFAGVLDDEA